MATEEAVDDIMRAREWAARIVRSTSPGGRAAALSVGYVALYLALDRLSFIGALHGIGITPWNPSTGLAMALLIIKGLRYAPLVMAAELLSGATLPIAPISAVPVCLGSLVVTAGYTGAAAVLRHAGLQAGIRRSSDVVKLIIVTIISSGLVAGGFVASYAAEGVVPFSGFVEAGFHFWIGDAIGIVVVVPPLLLLYERITQWTPPDYDRPHFDSSSSPHRARALSRRSQPCSRESVAITLSGFSTCCFCLSSGSRRAMVYLLRAGR